MRYLLGTCAYTYLLGVQNVSTADENGSGDDSGENSHRVLHDCI